MPGIESFHQSWNNRNRGNAELLVKQMEEYWVFLLHIIADTNILADADLKRSSNEASAMFAWVIFSANPNSSDLMNTVIDIWDEKLSETFSGEILLQQQQILYQLLNTRILQYCEAISTSDSSLATAILGNILPAGTTPSPAARAFILTVVERFTESVQKIVLSEV